jgi:hypothetical protein
MGSGTVVPPAALQPEVVRVQVVSDQRHKECVRGQRQAGQCIPPSISPVNSPGGGAAPVLSLVSSLSVCSAIRITAATNPLGEHTMAAPRVLIPRMGGVQGSVTDHERESRTYSPSCKRYPAEVYERYRPTRTRRGKETSPACHQPIV